MSTTTTTPAETTTTETAPVRNTWKQLGNPLSGWEFYGTAIKAPQPAGLKVAKVEVTPQGIILKGGNGRQLKGGAFGVATKFWAIVPDDAPRKVTAPAEPKAKADKLAPVVITAAKGGDKTVPPIKGAIAKAIKDSGETVLGISRKHGLNPAQMRRLTLDQVAKVDLVRAEVIAAALGKPLAALFGEATAKGKNGKAATPPATTGTKVSNKADRKNRRPNRTARANAKAGQDAAGRQAPENGVTTEAAPETAPATETPAE